MEALGTGWTDQLFAWMDTEKVWHINCLELRVFHLVLEYFLPKCITALFLENGQHRYTYDACKSQRDAPFYVPINIFSLSELCMFPSAGLVWQPSPELWNLHVWSVSRACQYHKTHHTEYCAQEWTPFSRCLYAHKWREFMNWCAAQNDDRVNCPMSAILSFLQECLDCSCASSSLKVYVSVSQPGSWWIVQ